MIHYNVWFSFKDGTIESDELAKVNRFLLSAVDEDTLGETMTLAWQNAQVLDRQFTRSLVHQLCSPLYARVWDSTIVC